MNTQGRLLRLTSFGESHGVAVGGVLDGMPAGLRIDMEAVARELERRRPGQSSLTTGRQEADQVEILSGLLDGCTLGSPIAFVIYNKDQRSRDYSLLEGVYRPSHADYTYKAKYGIRDHRGGGRASARETAVRVVAGAIARQLLETRGIHIVAMAEAIGAQRMSDAYQDRAIDLPEIESSPVRCPDPEASGRMVRAIEKVREAGDSLGGVVLCLVDGVPPGWGEPLYDKLSARLAAAMLSINAARGFELGEGFSMATRRGSEVNDEMYVDDKGCIRHRSNHSAGILGGISTGETLRFRVPFKPTASIAHRQSSINQEGEPISLEIHGRHDPCVVPRAVPVVEAQAALVLADFLLLSEAVGHNGISQSK